MKTILFFDNGGKTHTCETPEIAEAVIIDLASRSRLGFMTMAAQIGELREQQLLLEQARNELG